MFRNKKFIYLSIAVVLSISCATTDDVKQAQDNLDIELPKMTVTKASVSSPVEPDDKVELRNNKIANPQEVFIWQHSFKSAPRKSEKQKIEMTLKTYNSPGIEELLKKARNLAAIGQYIEAEATYQALIRLDLNLFDAYIELADLYIKQKKIDKSLDYIASARSVLDENRVTDKLSLFRYRYTLGLAYLASEREKKGQSILSDLIAVEPTFEPAYVALASHFLKKSKYNMAEFVVKRGIDNNQKSPNLLNILGVLHREKGNSITALKYFNEALSINSDHVPSLVNRAMLSMSRQQYLAAENDFKKAIGLDTSHVNAYIGLALIEVRTGRYVNARINLVRAIDLDPENIHARFNLAVLLVNHLDDHSRALRLFHEVTQLAMSGSVLELTARSYLRSLSERQL